MPDIVKNLLLSKKFVVALLTGGGAIAMYFGWNVDPTKILIAISPFLMFIGAQGWADSGKEQALVAQATAIKTQQMAQEHDIKMTALRPSLGLNAAPPAPPASGALPGFAGLEVMLVLAVVGLVVLWLVAGGSLGLLACVAASVAAGALSFRSRRCRARRSGAAVVGAALCLAASCAHPVQTTLRVGQCILDNGVLGDVLNALAQQGYVQAIEDVGLRDAPELIDCALQAVAAPQPGSGSAARTAAAPDTLAQRAREVLASRRAAGK